MSSTVTALPRSGWWSWRLTPWIQIRRPLTSRSPSRISTLRKPISWAWTSTTAPAGSSSSATTRYRVGRSADHGSTPASSNRLDATWPRNTYGSAKRCGTVGRDRRREPAATERLDGRTHRPALRRRARPADGGRHVERADAVGDTEPGVAHQRGEVRRAATDERDLAVQARHPPLVLVLHVAVRAVAHDDDRQVVAAGHETRGDVVLARQPAVGAVAGELSVDVDGVHAVGRRRRATRPGGSATHGAP